MVTSSFNRIHSMAWTDWQPLFLAQASPDSPWPSLHPIDWSFIIFYAVGMILIGVYYSRKKDDEDDYFIGGGKLNSSLVGISIFATLFSTISYLSQPGEVIKNGPFYLSIFLSIPFAYLFIGYVIIPIYMKQRVVSAYQILEPSLGSSIRKLGAALFISLRLVWMAVLIYMASSAITVIIGIPSEKIPWVIAGTGAVAITYTTLGGLRAVVISDVAQSAILLFGALFTIGVITFRMNGFSWFPTTWEDHWDPQPLFSFDPHVRVTVIGVIIMSFFWQICTAGGDQTAIQRYMATADAASARRAFLVNSILGVGIALVVATVGFALLGYYSQFPETVPNGQSVPTYADQLFPMFIGSELPVGFSGLVISALFAAAMSSVDSGINSITAVVQRDFLHKLNAGHTQSQRVLFSRGLALVIGVGIVLLATQVGKIPGNFLEIAKKATNLFAAPIFGLFLIALFTRNPTPKGAWIGTLWGFITSMTIAYWDVITGRAAISFMYIIPPALGVQVAVSLLVSRIPKLRSRFLGIFVTGSLVLFPFLLLYLLAL